MFVSYINSQPFLTSSMFAVLTAVNITDELFKEREAGDALRRQLKQYLDEASQAKNEVSELKREIFKLQQQKK